MEVWEEVFKGEIEKDSYFTELSDGETNGLEIILSGVHTKKDILIYFGALASYRVINESLIILDGLYDDLASKKFSDEKFSNVIYKITGGEFSESIKKVAGELYEFYELKHYIIYTWNYVIEVLTPFEPEVSYLIRNMMDRYGNEIL